MSEPMIQIKTKTERIYSVVLDTDQIETIVREWFYGNLPKTSPVSGESLTWGAGQNPSIRIVLVDKEEKDG